jgi:hypothetical protein
MRNLDSINRNGGLFSLGFLAEREIAIPEPGGNAQSHELDQEFGLDQFVHCRFFFDRHPMAYRAQQDGRFQEVIWFRIDVQILESPGILLTTDVANKTGVELLSDRRQPRLPPRLRDLHAGDSCLRGNTSL